MDSKIRILLLEDQSSDAELAEYEIKKSIKSYQIEWVDNRKNYTQALTNFDPDIIISDYNLPTFTGLEALKIKQALKPDVPLIIYTGSINEDTAVNCMKAGAVDYIIKEHLKRLGPAILSALEQTEVIVAKRKAELELIKSEERFHRLADNLPDMIYKINLKPERVFEYVNPVSERITGYTLNEFYTETDLGFTIIHPDDRILLNEKIASGEYFFKSIVVRLIKKDGTIIWLEQRNIPIYDDNGNIIAIEGIAQDITEKRNNEILKQAIYNVAQAANSTRNLSELYIEVHKAIATIMPANNFYIAIYHKDRGEISFPYFIDENDSPPQMREFRKGLTEYVITTGESLLCNAECSKRLKAEGKIEIVGVANTIWLGIPLKFEENTIGIMALQHYHDETVYGQQEKNMLEYVSTQVAKAIVYKQAEHQIHQNTEQIAVQNIELHELINELNEKNDELITAKEKAEGSDRLKTAFLQNMSHEIRTPMNAIVGFSELMELEIDDPDKLKYFTKVIRKRADDLLEIINELLDIARIESGQLSFNTEQIDLNILLEELQSFYTDHKLQIEKSHLELIDKIIPKEINSTISTDPGKLKQIFVNLIHNAFKFTNHGKIEFGFHSLNNDSITFFVSDTGVGISENMQELIFERFRKSLDESVYIHDGLGLGLAIVKGLIKLFDGEIKVESEVNKGSTFYFSIPYIPFKQLIIAEEQVIKTSIDWSAYTILIVEDDSFNIAYFEELLRATKVNYLIASTGQRASLLFNTNKNITLVLMDLKLPDISGNDLTFEFKKLRPNIPIIAQTAYAAEIDKHKAFEAGCDDFITKPIKKDKLLEIINKYLTISAAKA